MMKGIAFSGLLLIAITVLGSGCTAPGHSTLSSEQSSEQRKEAASATLEPSADLPSGAFKASGNKKAPVRLMIYVPGRLGGSAVAFPYDLTMQMLVQLQKEYPGKIRAEVYAIDTREGMKMMKDAHLRNPSVVMTVRRSGERAKRQVFDMVSEKKVYKPLDLAGQIRQALNKEKTL